jgi:hypothetical protein
VSTIKFTPPAQINVLADIVFFLIVFTSKIVGMLACSNCMKLMDRDAVASMNMASRGGGGFAIPWSFEAVKGNVDFFQPLIRVDGSK